MKRGTPMFGNVTALEGLHVTGQYMNRSMQHTCSMHTVRPYASGHPDAHMLHAYGLGPSQGWWPARKPCHSGLRGVLGGWAISSGRGYTVGVWGSQVMSPSHLVRGPGVIHEASVQLRGERVPNHPSRGYTPRPVFCGVISQDQCFGKRRVLGYNPV